MNKRIVSLLLVFVLLLGMTPVRAAEAEEEALPFRAAVSGEELRAAAVVPEGYVPYEWNGTEMVPGAPITLYVVVVPEGTTEVSLVFEENRLAYNYKDGATYLAGEYADAFTGADSAVVPVDADGDGLADYIQVQSPYDADWHTDMLYAVTFLGAPLPFRMAEAASVTVTPEGYVPYEWNGTEMVPGTPVTLYTVTVPADTDAVSLLFPGNRLAYNYKDGATYLAGEYDDAFTGADSVSVPVDANGDGVADYIQVQSPYDADWHTDMLYAITFAGAPGPFRDLRGAWYRDAALFAAENGLMEGVERQFLGDEAATRAQAVTVLWRWAGKPAPAASDDFGVEDGMWYTDALRWAAGEAIVKGTDDGLEPMREITREEFAVMLYRYLQTQGEGFTGTWMLLLDCEDREEISGWAYEAMCYLSMNDVLTGLPDKRMAPGKPASRAELAVLFQRLAARSVTEDEAAG